MEDLGEESEIIEDGVDVTSGDKTKASASKTAKSSGKKKAAAQDAAEDTVSTSSERSMPQVDVRGILDGYQITSYSTNRAIVSGPGGSRVVRPSTTMVTSTAAGTA